MMVASKNGFASFKPLPYDVEVEYLKFNNVTGVLWTTDISIIDNYYIIECDGKITAVNGAWNSLFLTYANESSQSTHVIVYDQNLSIAYAGYRRQASSQTSCSSPSFSFTNRNTFKLEYCKLTITPHNGNPIVYDLSIPSGTAGNDGKIRSTNLGVKWYYSLKVWHNNELILDWIPVRKGTIGHFFDKVTQALVDVNQTNLELGPDKV